MRAESHTSRARTAHLVLALAVVVAAPLTAFVAMGRADAASGTVFEVGQVIAEIKRQIAAADAGAGVAGGLRIEDAQLDLALVEHPGGRGALVVAGADYTAGTKEETPRPALKRRLVLEVQPARTPPAGAAPAAEAPLRPRQTHRPDERPRPQTPPRRPLAAAGKGPARQGGEREGEGQIAFDFQR